MRYNAFIKCRMPCDFFKFIKIPNKFVSFCNIPNLIVRNILKINYTQISFLFYLILKAQFSINRNNRYVRFTVITYIRFKIKDYFMFFQRTCFRHNTDPRFGLIRNDSLTLHIRQELKSDLAASGRDFLHRIVFNVQPNLLKCHAPHYDLLAIGHKDDDFAVFINHGTS